MRTNRIEKGGAIDQDGKAGRILDAPDMFGRRKNGHARPVRSGPDGQSAVHLPC